MTKIMNGVKILTYDEWVKQPGVKELKLGLPECDVCDGSGEHECECGHTHECQQCEGTGRKQDIREIYEKTLRNELEKLLCWKEGRPIKRVTSDHEYKQNGHPALISLNIIGNAKSV